MRFRTIVGLVSLLAIAACSRPTPPGDSSGAAAPSSQTVEHLAVGTVNSVDTSARTVNISHDAVPSIGWPAMTMDFKLADPDSAAGLKPGQRIGFHFTAESGTSPTVTDIQPIN